MPGEKDISRGEFFKLAGIGLGSLFALLYLPACAPPENKPAKIRITAILSEDELIGQLSAMIENKGSVTDTQEITNIIASVAYNAIIFWGGNKQTALDRTENIVRAPHSHATNCPQGSAGCSYGTTAEFIESIMNEDHPPPAVRLFDLIAHESYHVWPVIQNRKNASEDYGFLGVRRIKKTQGFLGDGEFAGSYDNPLLFENQQFSLPEEFGAQWASYRYAKHLYESGLNNPEFEMFIAAPHLGYLNLVRSVNKIESAPWQDFWGGTFSAGVFDDFHLRGVSLEFFHNLGSRINELSYKKSPLQIHVHTDPDLAGLGLLGFRAFTLGAGDTLDHYQILRENRLENCVSIMEQIRQDNPEITFPENAGIPVNLPRLAEIYSLQNHI